VKPPMPAATPDGESREGPGLEPNGPWLGADRPGDARTEGAAFQ
jgi:hypothetical protein